MPDAVIAEVPLTQGRGNAGPVESVEKQKQLSHSFHRPLEISQKTRDFHIPTAWLRGYGKVENQRQVSHFPTAARNDDHCSLCENQTPKKGSRPLRGLLIPYPFSLRSNGTDFMLILQLENAEVPLPENGILSRTLFNDEAMKIVAFGFCSDQELSADKACRVSW